MATTVDTLLVRIEADMSELKKSLDKVQQDVDKASKGIAGKFKQLGSAFKGVLGVLAVREAAQAGMAMINLASDIEEMQGKSKVVFGAFRDQVVADLEEFGNAVGRSTFELEGMASAIQDTFVPMGFSRGEASKLSVELTKLAVDVASFNNASDTETMEAFQSALVGNHETVRRFGVVITEATLNQELMRMGIEKGTKAATNAQKVQARLNLITQGTSDAHGDAARTADSFANQTRALLAELNELAAGLTARFLPAVTKVVAAMRQGAEATKRFLQELGIIEMPVADELVFVSAQIDELENKLVSLRQAEESAKNGADEMYGAYAGYAVDGAKDAINELTAQVEALKGRREELSEAIVMGQFIPPADMGFDKGTGTTTTQEDKDAAKRIAQQQSDLKALADANRTRHDVENRLADAIRKKNKQEEINARMSLAIMDLRKQFPDLSNAELTAEARLIAHREHANRVGAESISISEKRRDELLSTADEMKNIADPLRQLKILEDEYNAALQAGLVTTEQHAAAMAKLREEMEKLKEKTEELDPAFKDMKDTADQAFEKLSDALTEMVMKGKFDMKSLGDLFKQTIREMIADAIKAQIIKPILSSIFGAIGGSITGPIGTFISGIGKAGGGDIDRPTLVGERGPELFVPHSAGTVLNNHNTKNALGGGGATIVNQTINVETGVSQTVRAEMLSLLPRFKQDTMAAVVDAKRRGGSYGSAFG